MSDNWNHFSTVPRDGRRVILAQLLTHDDVVITFSGSFDAIAGLWNCSGTWIDEQEDRENGILFAGWCDFPDMSLSTATRRTGALDA